MPCTRKHCWWRRRRLSRRSDGRQRERRRTLALRLALGRGRLFCLKFVAQLGAVNRGAVGCTADCRAAHASGPLSMRAPDCRVFSGHRLPRCRRRGACSQLGRPCGPRPHAMGTGNAWPACCGAGGASESVGLASETPTRLRIWRRVLPSGSAARGSRGSTRRNHGAAARRRGRRCISAFRADTTPHPRMGRRTPILK
jgi:hypothetical protein